MAQHDYNIANQTFPNTRTDINNALSAVASNNSGTAAPSTTFANQWFYETDTNLLQIRNEDNDAYITIAELDQSNDTVEYFKSDSIRTALIEFTDGDDAITIADGGACTFGVGVTITTADNTDTLTLTSTDADASSGPNLRLYRNSSSPADSDILGVLEYEGRNDNSEDITYVQLTSFADDVSDGTEDGSYFITTMHGGTLRNRINVRPTEVVVNEESIDSDFRCESNDDAKALFVDAGNNVVGIGATTPSTTFKTSIAGDGSSIIGGIQFRNAASGGETFTIGHASATSTSGRLNVVGAGNLIFNTNNTERVRIGSNGNIGIGQTDTTPALGINVADTRVTSGVCLDVHHSKSDTTFSGIVARFQSARNTTNETYEFIRCAISGIANKLFVHDSGDVDNANNSYGGISDERVKQDIVDANSQWNDIKSLKVKNFRKKANVRDFGDDALTEIGVIAQDLEAVGMNGLVKECQPDPSHVYSDSSFGTVWTADDPETQDFVLFTADDEEVQEGNAQIGDIKKQSSETIGEVKEVKSKVKTVKYSVLYMKAIKALQEAMQRIEALESKIN